MFGHYFFTRRAAHEDDIAAGYFLTVSDFQFVRFMHAHRHFIMALISQFDNFLPAATFKNLAAGWTGDYLAVSVFYLHDAAMLGQNRFSLWTARFKQFFHSRQTLRNVAAGHTAQVESTHCQLGARLANGLGRDNAHGGDFLYNLIIA